MNKYLIIGVVAILVIAGGWWYFTQSSVPATSETTQLPSGSENSNVATQPANCINGPVQGPNGLEEGIPVITSITPSSGPKGTKATIRGCNLSGFEGDHNVDLERSDGTQIRLRGEGTYQLGTGGSGTSIEVTIKEPCQQGETVYGDYSGIPSLCKYVELTPGMYKVSTAPWGKKSNVVNFTMTSI